MKPSEYYEHQLNEEQLRSDQLQDQIDTLKCQLDDLKAERKELMEALRCLMDCFEQYDEPNNPCRQRFDKAREALKKSSETP